MYKKFYANRSKIENLYKEHHRENGFYVYRFSEMKKGGDKKDLNVFI